MTPLLRTIGWGVFCACSWTWCIGMFLPHIMLDRWGWAGFLVFAIPNVLGCAAMGYVVRSADASRALCATHETAARWFSLVTIGYHTWFAAFAARFLLPAESPLWLASVLPVSLLAAGLLIARIPARAWLPLGVAVYALSLVTLATLGAEPLRAGLRTAGSMSGTDLAFTAPVIVIGFLLCPYLDLTFHRARQHAPSRHAFGVFGVTFAIMILLTCAYKVVPTGFAAALVVVHVSAQAVFTVAAHVRELNEPASAPTRATPTGSGPWLAVGLAPALLLPLTGLFDDPAAAGRDIYLRFLVIYGLLAPAYVLLCMTRPGMPRRAVRVFFIAIVALMPLYELGYLHAGFAWMLLIPAGLGLVQAARRLAARAPAEAG